MWNFGQISCLMSRSGDKQNVTHGVGISKIVTHRVGISKDVTHGVRISKNVTQNCHSRSGNKQKRHSRGGKKQKRHTQGGKKQERHSWSRAGISKTLPKVVPTDLLDIYIDGMYKTITAKNDVILWFHFFIFFLLQSQLVAKYFKLYLSLSSPQLLQRSMNAECWC